MSNADFCDFRKFFPSKTWREQSRMPGEGNYRGIKHVFGNAQQGRGVNDFLRRDAAVYRWVGFIQGILWMTGVMSIDDMRKLNDTEIT